MAGGCRDCSRCTETGLVSLLLAIPRLLLWFVTIFGIFRKKSQKSLEIIINR